jgi:hypothetical protein
VRGVDPILVPHTQRRVLKQPAALPPPQSHLHQVRIRLWAGVDEAQEVGMQARRVGEELMKPCRRHDELRHASCGMQAFCSRGQEIRQAAVELLAPSLTLRHDRGMCGMGGKEGWIANNEVSSASQVGCQPRGCVPHIRLSDSPAARWRASSGLSSLQVVLSQRREWCLDFYGQQPTAAVSQRDTQASDAAAGAQVNNAEAVWR